MLTWTRSAELGRTLHKRDPKRRLEPERDRVRAPEIVDEQSAELVDFTAFRRRSIDLTAPPARLLRAADI
jgi:hypothetical protein